MLREILFCSLDGQTDIEVVGGERREADLLEVVEETEADVVVLGCRRPELPSFADRLLEAFPWVGLLSVSTDGRRAYRYRLRYEGVPLGEASQEGLVAAIRRLGARRLRSSRFLDRSSH